MSELLPSMRTMSIPAPNWYPDPYDATAERWWDGQTWTHHMRPRPAPVLNIEVNTPPVSQNVVVRNDRKRVNHLLHLVLTILTVGLWAPVWIVLAFANS